MTCPWSGFERGTIDWCEERLCAWVVEPSNAWSNLAYVVVGLVILATARRRRPLSLIGVACLLIGPASFAFHGTGTRWGELVDVSAMYLLSGLGVMFGARRAWSLSARTLVCGYVALVALSVGLMLALHSNGIVVFGSQIAITVAFELVLYRRGRRFPSYRPYQVMVACFASAFLIWNLDKWRILCSPTNHLLTGHAVWHALTALSVYFFARQQAQLLESAG